MPAPRGIHYLRKGGISRLPLLFLKDRDIEDKMLSKKKCLKPAAAALTQTSRCLSCAGGNTQGLAAISPASEAGELTSSIFENILED